MSVQANVHILHSLLIVFVQNAWTAEFEILLTSFLETKTSLATRTTLIPSMTKGHGNGWMNCQVQGI